MFSKDKQNICFYYTPVQSLEPIFPLRIRQETRLKVPGMENSTVHAPRVGVYLRYSLCTAFVRIHGDTAEIDAHPPPVAHRVEIRQVDQGFRAIGLPVWGKQNHLFLPSSRIAVRLIIE